MFIQNLQTDPWFYFAVLTVVILSIVLHELAHGWAAIWQGDDTPRELGHLTLNPLTHMGWMSLGILAVVGIAWGMMPVNPSRFRSRYGDALVSAAGPAMNLLLAVLALSAVGVIERVELHQQTAHVINFFQQQEATATQPETVPASQQDQPDLQIPDYQPSIYLSNAKRFLSILGTMNLVLMMLNLIPLPPLDGSSILANFSRKYAKWIDDPEKKSLLLGMFILVFFFSAWLFSAARFLRDAYLGLILWF